jgi:hypothetical protein
MSKMSRAAPAAAPLALNQKMEQSPAPEGAGTTDYDAEDFDDALEEDVAGITESADRRRSSGLGSPRQGSGDRARIKSAGRRESSGPRWIERILSLVFSRKERNKARPAAIDRAPHRQQALDLLQSLQASQAADASAKLAAMRAMAAKLDELFQNLISAGDLDPSVKALGEALLRLHTLVAASQPAETDMLDVWMQIENSLQRWLALSETPQSPRREGFWK